MGNDEVAAHAKSEKTSSPMQEQPIIHPYSDWATMQAYYGPGVAMPPFLAAAVASGHAPHPYMWGPQPFLPPYGAPYPAFYAQGAYSHPPVPLGSHFQLQGITPAPSTNEAVVMATPLSVESPVKSSGDKGRSLLKKLKGLDGLPVSHCNDNAVNTSGSAMLGMSQSGESGAEGSSEGSDGNNESGENNTQRRGGSEETLTLGKTVRAARQNNAVDGGETNESSKMPSFAPSNMVGKQVVSCSPFPTVRCWGAANEVKASASSVSPPPNVIVPSRDGLPLELRMQDERARKREKRKQSNRESARRSRLRKQAETEELALRVHSLGSENTTLRNEIARLKENSEKLRMENSALLVKLEEAEIGYVEDRIPERVDSAERPPVNTINFLSKVNNSNSFAGHEQQEKDVHNTKLHQLLGPSSRSDAVMAG